MPKIYKTFNAKGIVIGNLWDGGLGTYPSIKFNGFQTESDLYKEIRKQLKSGLLDSGMGYENLIGALMKIEEIRSMIYKRKTFISSRHREKFFGKISDLEKDFLEESKSLFFK